MNLVSQVWITRKLCLDFEYNFRVAQSWLIRFINSIENPKVQLINFRACLNLANMYERGNKSLGIMTDKRKAEEYRVKAWYQTEEGQKHIAMANLPTAGSVF